MGMESMTCRKRGISAVDCALPRRAFPREYEDHSENFTTNVSRESADTERAVRPPSEL